MSLRPSLRFAILAASVAVLSGAVAVGMALRSGGAAWAVVGWAPVAVAGIAGGAWLAEAHGRMNRSFFLAFALGMAGRSVAVIASVLCALTASADAWKPCLAGLAAGYFPLQVFEIGWFLRAGVRHGPSAEARHDAKGLA